MGLLVRIVNTILCIGQLAVAGLVIGLVASRMNKVSVAWNPATLSAAASDTCLMGTTETGVNLCYVSYGFASVSIAATAALAILRCCTCNMCGLGFVFDAVFAAAGTAWWALAGVVFKYWMYQPPVLALPEADTRQAIVILAFIGCALFGLSLLLNLFNCLCCCGGKGRGYDEERGGSRSKSAPVKEVHTYFVPVPQGHYVSPPTHGNGAPHVAPIQMAPIQTTPNPAYWPPPAVPAASR